MFCLSNGKFFLKVYQVPSVSSAAGLALTLLLAREISLFFDSGWTWNLETEPRHFYEISRHI